MATTTPLQKELTPTEQAAFLALLKTRFEKNRDRHQSIAWSNVSAKLEKRREKCWSLHEMERTGGEPDVVAYEAATDEYLFVDCAAESPKARRSVCYDAEARTSRKEHPPAGSAMEMASEMGIRLLTEAQYRFLQGLGTFDTKTSSWIETPAPIRKLGGALFGDYRYGHVFIYHNGASSYYGARGFRGALWV